MCIRDSSDTTYYVDPNGGSRVDTMEVVCRKMEKYDGWFTCIKPTEDIVVSIQLNLRRLLGLYHY